MLGEYFPVVLNESGGGPLCAVSSCAYGTSIMAYIVSITGEEQQQLKYLQYHDGMYKDKQIDYEEAAAIP
jgi:hypothetical protein